MMMFFVLTLLQFCFGDDGSIETDALMIGIPDERHWADADKQHPLMNIWHSNPQWFGTPWLDVGHLLPADVGRILHVGCGNSSWPEDMARHQLDVIHSDKSAFLIKRLKQEHPKLHFEVVDAAKIPYPDASFEAVVDKAMLDAVEEAHNAPHRKVVDEMYRVLKPGGTLFVVSIGAPLDYVTMFNDMDWATRKIISLDPSRYVYYWRKKGGGRSDPPHWMPLNPSVPNEEEHDDKTTESNEPPFAIGLGDDNPYGDL